MGLLGTLLVRLSVLDVLVFISVTLIGRFVLKLIRRPRGLPPGPWGLPLVGYIPFLGAEPHKTFRDLAKKYGPIFGFQLGARYAVVINNREYMLEALRSPDISRRPEEAFYMGPHIMHVAQDNDEPWTEQRKLVENHFKQFIKSKGHRSIHELIEEKTASIVEEIESAEENENVNVHDVFSKHLRDIMAESLWGHPLSHSETVKTTEFEEYEHYVLQQASPAPSYYTLFYPILAPFFRKISAYHRRNNDIGFRFKALINEKVKLHEGRESDETPNFIDNYFTYFKKQAEPTESTLNGNIQILMIAGTDTIASSLEFLLLTLAKNQDVQENIYQEILEVCGTERKISWNERYKLPYTLATIYEGQRHHLIVPVSTVRGVIKDTVLKGYLIPKDSLVFANSWLVHNDPDDWVEPEKFKPERYLNEDGSFNNNQFLLTFSTGKRVCPGKEQALITLFMFIAATIQRFKIVPSNKGVSLRATSGLVIHPLEPEARFLRR